MKHESGHINIRPTGPNEPVLSLESTLDEKKVANFQLSAIYNREIARGETLDENTCLRRYEEQEAARTKSLDIRAQSWKRCHPGEKTLAEKMTSED